MIHMKVKPFLHVNHNVWFLFIVVFLNESRETAWEMYLPLLCHWGWKRRHEWTQDLYFCANNSKKWGPELVKRGPERTQDLYSGRYNEKGRSWVSEKRSRADSGPLFWTLQWKREVLSLWKELLRVSHFLKLLHKKPALILHHGEQGARDASLPIMGLLVHIAMRTPITLDYRCAWIRPCTQKKIAHGHSHAQWIMKN